MGLLDGLLSALSLGDDPNDPRRARMQAIAAGLLGNRNWQQGLSQGLMAAGPAYQGARMANAKLAEEGQQADMRKMQIEQMRRQNSQQAAMDSAASRNFQPGMPQMQPNDYETPSGPTSPGQMNWAGYGRDIASINPQAALALQAQLTSMQQKERGVAKPGETIGTWQGDKFVPQFTAADKPHWVDAGDKMIPVDNQGKPVGAPIPKSMSPDARASNSIAREGLNLKKFEADPFNMFGINGGAGGAQAAPAGFDTSKMPQAVRDQAQAMVEGRIAPPSSFALKTPYWNGMLQLAQQIDPNFDATVWSARNKLRSDTGSGKVAGNVKSLATAANHLGALADAYDALGNNRVPLANTVMNAVGNAGFSQDVQKNYASVATKAEAVSHELAKVFRDSGMSQTEVANWAKQISPNAAPAQSKETISSALDLMEGRLAPIVQQWQGTMGNSPMPKSLTDAISGIQKMRDRLEGPAAAERGGHAAAMPANSVQLPGGKVMTFPSAAAAAAFKKQAGIQ
jgi:hypothetical protein